MARDVIALSLGTLLAWAVWRDTNTELTYGPTGLPMNCRALIAANVEGWRAKSYTAEAALESIDRNCGRFGNIWGK